VSLIWILTEAQAPAGDAGPGLSRYKLKQNIVLELYGNGLYYFPPVEIKVSWHDAKRICESIGLHLLFLDTPEEYDWINIPMYEKKRMNVEHWTSGKRDGKWIWDATKDDIRDMRQYPGYSPGKEECLAIWAYNNYQHQTSVFDRSCKNLYSFVCKLMN